MASRPSHYPSPNDKLLSGLTLPMPSRPSPTYPAFLDIDESHAMSSRAPVRETKAYAQQTCARIDDLLTRTEQLVLIASGRSTSTRPDSHRHRSTHSAARLDLAHDHQPRHHSQSSYANHSSTSTPTSLTNSNPSITHIHNTNTIHVNIDRRTTYPPQNHSSHNPNTSSRRSATSYPARPCARPSPDPYPHPRPRRQSSTPNPPLHRWYDQSGREEPYTALASARPHPTSTSPRRRHS